MAEILVGKISDFARGDLCRVVLVEGREIGIREVDGAFYAYENRCLHQGGPICEGLVVGKVEQAVGPAGEALEQRFSEQTLHLVCPWHGWEYDLRTGEFVGDRRRRLRRYDVVQRGDEVLLVV